MTSNPFSRVLAVLLVIILVAPTTFLVAPQRASASSVSCIGGLLGLAGAATGAVATVVSVPVSDVVDQSINGSTAGTTYGSCLYDVILVPLMRAAIRTVIQKMTASIVNWINGKSSGTGQPSYPTDLRAMLQSVGDAVAIPFINQISAGFMSPFGPAISSALGNKYMQQTTLGGFFAANRCTLSASSQNMLAFLHGNWSQGGAATWLALTTQTQNNPYTLYQNSLAQIANTVGAGVGGAVGARVADLGWGSGFMSWCGAGDASTQTQNSAVTQYQQCMANGGTGADCQFAFDNAGGKMSSGGAIKIGDPCVDSKGVPGKMQTPGSIIHDYTKKAVADSGFDQLISANDLDVALNTILNALLNKVLGTAGGLFGASQPSGSGSSSITSQLNSFQGTSPNSVGTANQTAETISSDGILFEASWKTIETSAKTASTSVLSLASFCTAAADTAAKALIAPQNTSLDSTYPYPYGTDPATVHSTFVDAARTQAATAQTILTTKIAGVLTQAQTAFTANSIKQAFALKVKNESLGDSASPELAGDLVTLGGMPPSTADVSNAQSNAVATGGGSASPTGSLTISSGTLVDQMNLISTNATLLKTSVCTFSPNSDPVM